MIRVDTVILPIELTLNTIQCLDVSFIDPNMALFGFTKTQSDLPYPSGYITYNRGLTWQQLQIPVQAITSVWIDRTNDSRIWAATNKGLWFSIDRGISWQQDSELCEGYILGVKQVELENPGCYVLYSSVSGKGLYRNISYPSSRCSISLHAEESNSGELNSSSNIYPNPVMSNWITVETDLNESVLLSITDIQGNLIQQSVISESPQKISLPNLSPGFYQAQIIGKNKRVNRKLVILDF